MWDLQTQEGLEIPDQGPVYLTDRGLFFPGRASSIRDLEEGRRQTLPGVTQAEWSRAASSEEGWICMTQPQHLWCLDPEDRAHRYPANPLPWYAPATGQGSVAWVEEIRPGERVLLLRRAGEQEGKQISDVD